MARAPRSFQQARPPSRGIVAARSQHKGALDKIKVREGAHRARHNDDDIVGREDDVMGIGRHRVVDEIAKKLARERGRPDKRMADLRLPAARNVRPQTIDGRTSFHFSHEAVSKTRNNMEKDSGLKIGPGAARKHGKYIERESAVAMMSDKERAELDRLMDGDPELKARLTEDGQDQDGGRGNAALHGYYVERQEALATQPDGEKVLFTNISADPLERSRVWDKIEEFERDPSPDELIIHVGKNQAFWDRVREEPDFPKALADAMHLADPAKPYRFQTDDARSSLRWLRQQPDWNKEDPQVVPKLGEGGRTQYRIIGELPHEVDLRSRTAILAEFANEFERRKLPYVAVMHAPDHTNDDRNWHFHLIYYDRPISKMDDGRWDFEVSEEYVDKKYNRRVRWPHRQDKDKEVDEKAWIPKMRKRLAEITNDHLQMSGQSRRVDPRRYNEMGIHREAQEHLGTRAAALEAMGVATPGGYRNANKDWDAVELSVERKREASHQKTDVQARRYHDKADRMLNDDPRENMAFHGRIERWRQDMDEAAEYRAYAESINKQQEKAVSRAEKVVRTCEKQIAAAQEGRSSNHKKSNTVSLGKRQMEALAEISDANKFMKPMLDAALLWAKEAERLSKQAEREAVEIERRLARSPAEMNERTNRVKREAAAEKAAAEHTFQGKDGEYRRALNKIEMDAWVESIRQGRRRLVRNGRRIEPATQIASDKDVLAAGNYGVMTARLDGIKKAQDKVIGDVVAYIAKNPHAVLRERDPQGDVVLSLRVSRPQWQSAFKDYSDDPDMRKASLDALAIRDAARGRQTETAGRDADRTRTPEPATGRASAPTPDAPVPTGVEPAVGKIENPIDRMLRRIESEPLRLRQVDGAFTIDAKALEAIGGTAKDLAPEFVQKRLKGIHREQQRDLARLDGFVATRPFAIVSRDGRLTLGPKSPPAFVAIAEKWSKDDDLQTRLREIKGPQRAPAKSREETRTPVAPRPVQPTPVEPVRPVTTPAAEPVRAQAPEPVRPEPAVPEVAKEPTAPIVVETPKVETPERVPAEPVARTSTPDQEKPVERTAAEPEPVAGKPTPEEPKVAAEKPKEPTATRPEPAQSNLFGDDREGAAATGQAVFDKPRPAFAPVRGDNPTIDAWMKAGEKNVSLAERRRLAMEVSRNQQALAAITEADPELARQLRADADAHRRMEMLGLKPRRGRTGPKR